MTLLLRLLALAGALAAAPAYAFSELADCSPSEAASRGSVESVRKVPVPRDLHAFDPAILEHAVRPELVEELVVRLDQGPRVVFIDKRPYGLQPGERVRVILKGAVARLEAEPAACLVAPLAAYRLP
jgi:hypothetical protein